jgi:hypothetical protein
MLSMTAMGFFPIAAQPLAGEKRRELVAPLHLLVDPDAKLIRAMGAEMKVIGPVSWLDLSPTLSIPPVRSGGSIPVPTRRTAPAL